VLGPHPAQNAFLATHKREQRCAVRLPAREALLTPQAWVSATSGSANPNTHKNTHMHTPRTQRTLTTYTRTHAHTPPPHTPAATW
jgi:hypothetical protein